MVHEVLNLVYPLSDKPIHHGVEERFCCHIDKYNVFLLNTILGHFETKKIRSNERNLVGKINLFFNKNKT
jgi:hypothetical protein